MSSLAARTLAATLALAALAACSQPMSAPRAPRATSSTAVPDTNGRVAPTPMNTAPAGPMR